MKIIEFGEKIVKIVADEGFIFQNKENKTLLSREVICHKLTIKNYEEIKWKKE
jgi:hypothetical protein